MDSSNVVFCDSKPIKYTMLVEEINVAILTLINF